MNGYRSKKKYRDQKLTRQGFYERRQQQSRARRRAAREAASSPVPSFKQIASPDNLIAVYEKLKRDAGQAPGPDRITFNHLSKREVAEIMRDLSKEIRSGTYHPSRARTVSIPKASGKGHRTLKIRSIVYRVVSAALATAIGPGFEKQFLPGSHGYRSNRSPWTMLLDMERIIAEEQRFVIAQDDIANAFDNVAIDYAMDLYRQQIDEKQLITLIKEVSRGHEAEQRTIGIDQGSATSTLTLNVVLHHALDTFSFSENAAHPPWLRYADNIVYLCHSVYEGEAAIQEAQTLLRPTGMTLKGEDGPPVDIRKERIKLLGFIIHWKDGQIRYEMPEENWSNLEKMRSDEGGRACS